MTSSRWLTLLTGFMICGGIGCSSDPDSPGNSGDAAGAGASQGSGGDGTSTRSTTATSAGTTGAEGGTGGTDGTGGVSEAGASGSGGDGGTSSANCPSAEPELGSACDEGQTCAFEYCEAPRYLADRTLTCVDGGWVLSHEVPCDDAPATCPSYIPEVGQTCDASETTGPCSSLDACGIVTTLWCNDGTWSATRPDGAPVATGGGSDASAVAGTTVGGIPFEPMCPAEPPVLGESCCPNEVPQYCDYTSGAQGGSAGSGGVPGQGGAGGANLVPATESTTVGSVGGSGGSGGAVTAECVACSADQVWVASELCP